MDEMSFIDRLNKLLKTRETEMKDAMTSGAVDNMQKYSYMLGQIRTYQYISQEISSLLNKKEQYEQSGTIIDINSTTKN